MNEPLTAEQVAETRKLLLPFQLQRGTGTINPFGTEEVRRQLLDSHELLRAQRDKARTQLGNLLAVIHGDGGHYQNEHGTAKACTDAESRYYALLQTREAALEVAEAIDNFDAPKHGRGDLMNEARGMVVSKARALAAALKGDR